MRSIWAGYHLSLGEWAASRRDEAKLSDPEKFGFICEAYGPAITFLWASGLHLEEMRLQFELHGYFGLPKQLKNHTITEIKLPAPNQSSNQSLNQRHGYFLNSTYGLVSISANRGSLFEVLMRCVCWCSTERRTNPLPRA